MKNFILPNMYENYKLNLKLLNLIEKHPECFIENISIYAVYGNFQFCIWDGGRIFNQMHQASKEIILDVLNQYMKYNVKIRFIFTNTSLQPIHYHNRFCNVLLDIAKEFPVELVVNDDNLRDYIESKFPNKFSFISSTTRCLTDLNDVKNELNNNNYLMTCLDYNLNKNPKIFEMPKELIEKTELLCNAICAPGCPYRKEHYRLNSIYNLQYGKYYPMEGCKIKYNTLHPETMQYKNNISPEEIINKYEPAGFQYFKLEGRTLPQIENICNYVRYLVRPEYQLFVINYLENDTYK